MGYMTPGKSGIMGEKINPSPPAPKKMRGLGDLVKKVFEKVGVEVAVKKISKGKDCGCKRRQELLNKAVPFGGGNDDMQSDQD